MTREGVACRPEDDIEAAELAMKRHRRSRILCLGKHQYLLGVISLSDLALAESEGAEAVLEHVAAREAPPPRWGTR